MKKDYMTRLERWARWALPRQEAEDVIADYRDIVGDPPRPEPELLQDLGRPRDVVRPLTQPRQYRTWLAVFAFTAACVLIPGLSPLPGMAKLWAYCFYIIHIGGVSPGEVIPFLGIPAAILWFRLRGRREGTLPRAVPVLLAVMAVWLAGVLAVNWLWMRDPLGFAGMLGETPVYVLFGLVRVGPPGYTMSRSVKILQDVYMWGGFAMALVGVYALVKARTEDRRWAAVYTLAAMAMLVPISTLALMGSMEPLNPMTAGWWPPYFRTWAIYAGVGVAGAGVALC